MLKIITRGLPLIAALLALPSQAADPAFDAAMQPIAKEFMSLCDTLAQDKTDGVAQAALTIAKLSAKLPKASGKYAKIAADLATAGQKMSRAKDMRSLRGALMKLSKPVVLWTTLAKPKGIYVMYCSMAPGSWIQTKKKLYNPYFGSQMLHCGSIVQEG